MFTSIRTRHERSLRLVALLAVLVGTARAAGTTAAVENGPRIVLTNRALAMALDKARNGAVVSMTSERSGRELVAANPASPLFRLVFTRSGDASGETVTIDSSQAGTVVCETKTTAAGSSAVLRFSGFGDRRLDVQCTATVSEDEPLVLWSLSVACADPLVLEEAQYPLVVLKDTLGKARANDAFLAGATEDGRFLAPGDWSVGRKRIYNQPGSLAAQFACYYDPQGGLYTATRDGKGYPKRFAFERLGTGLGLIWSHLMHHQGPSPFVLPYAVALGVFGAADGAGPADWRDAADLYKSWATKQPWCARTISQRTDIPDWIKHGCIRVQWDLRSDGTPDLAADWVERHWRKNFGSLPPFMTFFGFAHIGSWVAPKYFPLYPSDEAFRAATGRIMGNGGHVFLFPSSYQWALTYDKQADGSFAWDDRTDFRKTALPHAMLNRDGSPFSRPQSWLRGGKNAALCRGDAWSRQFLTDTMLQLVDRGVDVLQMDQVVGGQWPAGAKSPCFSRDHGHPPGYGLWDVAAFHQQMQDLRQRCDDVRSGVVFSMESPQELFAQDFGLLDYRHARANVNVKVWDLSPRQHAAVFPYLYNEFVPVFHIPSHTEPVPIILAHAIASGEIPSFKPRQIEFPGTPAIRNGGFDEWSDNPAGWRVWRSDSAAKTTVLAGPAGKAGSAMWIENRVMDGTTMAYQCIPVDGLLLRIGETYRLRLRLTAQDMAGTASATVAALTSPNWWEWKELESWKSDLKPNTAWQDRTIPFAIPPGCRALRITLSMANRGKVAFDDLVLEHLGPGGVPAEVVRPGNAVFRMVRQAQCMDRGMGKYVMLGTALHPPPLQTETTRVTVSANKASSLSFGAYTLRSEQGQLVGTGHASCPLTITSGKGNWEHKSLEMTMVPGTTQFHVPMDLRQKGELLFDDFELTEVGSTGNLLRNPGFENWEDPIAVPPGWTHIGDYAGRTFTGTFQRETKDVHGGQYAIRLTNASQKANEEIHVKQVLPVDGTRLAVGKTYRLSFWVKVCGVSRWQPVNVEREYPVILHNAFRAPDGQEAVLLINITNQPQQGHLAWQGTRTQLTLAPWELRFLESPIPGTGP
jgi:hypothetical protein